MSLPLVHLALFPEDHVDSAAEAISRLHKLGVEDKDISVISGIPFSDKILGRPMSWSRVPLIALSGAVVGCLTAILLYYGTPLLYPITVGGMPLLTNPTSFVVIFELTMLGLLISTFIGVFIEAISPSFGPKGYSPQITDGKIGLLFTSPADLEERVHTTLSDLGAEVVHRSEEKLWL
jgi:hypothetical protein